ncbi:hypothetical protein C3V36_05395 [Lachnospiraceae bacterium oral taxon 500]|nr:hypothetical protein C3V36_05395 [Lachnospiraceae bacterium oral taxon 500]
MIKGLAFWGKGRTAKIELMICFGASKRIGMLDTAGRIARTLTIILSLLVETGEKHGKYCR